MSIGTKIFTWLYGRYVGQDEFGNKYYCNSNDFKNKIFKRWVIFNNKDIEASNIPPHWHAWLHKSVDNPPINYKHRYFWQIDHKPNMTGTKKAYYPNSYPLSKNYKYDDNKEYESWTP